VIEEPHHVEEARTGAEHQQQIDEDMAARATVVEGDGDDDGERDEERQALPGQQVLAQRRAGSAAPVSGQRADGAVERLRRRDDCEWRCVDLAERLAWRSLRAGCCGDENGGGKPARRDARWAAKLDAQAAETCESSVTCCC
jgi:hypothetical protein